MKIKKISTDESSKMRSGSKPRIIIILEKGTSKKRSKIAQIWIEIVKKIINKCSFLLSEGIKGKIALLKLSCLIF